MVGSRDHDDRDLVIFAKGSELPLVIRPSEIANEYTFVGPTMLHGWPGTRILPRQMTEEGMMTYIGLEHIVFSEDEMFLRVKEWLLAKREPADEETFNLS